MKKLRLGILGCGAISEHYLRSARDVFSDTQIVTACSDIVCEKAIARANEFGVKKALTPDELMDDPDIDLIVNLTVPKAHEELTIACLEHGKHVYTEKPVAMTRDGVERIMETAARLGLRVGCAPDSFMSAPMQTAKKIIESGWIGEPIGVTAVCAMRGNEYWRPDADFFYQKGAGPMLDMAAYYFNALISIIGSVRSVVAQSRITYPERTIKVAPRRGDVINVEVPTFVSGVFEFDNGAIGTFINSFDIWKSRDSYIEIYGEKGTLILPDPNRYEGEVLISRYGDNEWRVCPQLNEYSKYMRGVGIADMAHAIADGYEHRAGIEMAYHVTDIMLAFEEAAAEGVRKVISSKCSKPSGLWETEDTILWK